MRRTIFNESHDLFRRSVQQFIDREVAPKFDAWEQAGVVDKGLYLKAGEAGMMGILLPEPYGGGGSADFRFEAVVQEAFAASGMLNAGQGLINHNIAVAYFAALANEEQQQRWFPGLVSGSLLATVAMTEPGAGSDLSAISSRGDREGDDFVLNGAKTFISSGMSADLVIVVCKTQSTDKPHRDISLLVVEAGMKGFERGRNLAKIGQHAADTAELFFDDVRVPGRNLLGRDHEGFLHLMSNLAGERLGIAVVAVAHARAAFDWTLAYVKERHAFGQPIGSFQNSRFMLATMRTELDIAQVFVDRLIEAFVAGELTAEDAAEAKWWCTDLNKRTLDACLQLHGGYGYMEEYPIARAWRDGRAMCIYGGTNEIMKDLIGRRVLGV